MSTYDAPTTEQMDRPEPTIVNYYEELSLPADSTFAQLVDALDDQRRNWLSRSKRSGSNGEQARRMLALCDEALEEFSSETAREDYDLRLRRSRARQTEDEQPAQIDWLGRAWNYYFLHDDGAGRVAARYAREAEPKNPLVYVVSAWMHILSANANGRLTKGVDDTEIKQAKHDADEAFVLDELGTDTVDVHHVRGFVYYLLGNAEQAVNSYERALRAATDYEKPELFARKSWAHEALAAGSPKGSAERDAENNRMLESTLSGLSIKVDVSVQVVGWLTEATARAITYIAEGKRDAQAVLGEYRRVQGKLQQAAIVDTARSQLLAYVQENITRLEQRIAVEEQIAATEARMRELSAIEDSKGPCPSIPFISGIIGLVVLFAGFGLRDLWLIPVIGLVILAVAGFRIYRRVQWTGQRNAYTTAQEQLGEARGSLPKLNQRRQSLANPSAFAFRLA